MADHSAPDYPMVETLELDAEQLHVFSNETRITILDLLTDQAATVSQIARALGTPKGTIGHHMKRLEQAGLVRVVRTERVRAIEAKYYGRVARTFLLGALGERGRGVMVDKSYFLRQAIVDVERLTPAARQKPSVATLRHVRIPDERAQEWVERLGRLVQDFVGEPRGGDTRYGLVLALYPTDRPTIPEDDS